MGTARLPLQVAQARREFADNVAGAHQVVGRVGEFLTRLLTLGLMDRNAGGFLEELATFLGPLGKRLVDEALADDAVGSLAEA